MWIVFKILTCLYKEVYGTYLIDIPVNFLRLRTGLYGHQGTLSLCFISVLKRSPRIQFLLSVDELLPLRVLSVPVNLLFSIFERELQQNKDKNSPLFRIVILYTRDLRFLDQRLEYKRSIFDTLKSTQLTGETRK